MTEKEMLFKAEQERFGALALAESYMCKGLSEESGIGIYNEKRMHRILKRTVCDRESCFEIKVGRYVADVLSDGVITEIQCGSMRPLERKLKFYLENTDYKITVLHPLIAKKVLFRAQRESGEILRVRASPKKEDYIDGLAKLYPIRNLLLNDRISVRFMLCHAEEYRFSERMRYRREGKYDSELFPVSLVDSVLLSSPRDYLALLPRNLLSGEFTAKQFASLTSLKGRNVYSALHTLCALDLITASNNSKPIKFSLV